MPVYFCEILIGRIIGNFRVHLIVNCGAPPTVCEEICLLAVMSVPVPNLQIKHRSIYGQNRSRRRQRTHGQNDYDAVWNTEGAELVCSTRCTKEPTNGKPMQDAGASLGYNTGVKITDDYNVLRTCSAQVLIDFTRPEGTKEFLKICADVGIGMVIGTTGLDAEGKATIEESAKVIPIVFSPNMSAGVNVTYKLLELAAKLLKDYDAEIFEMHHSRKVDAPSGTAIAMGKAIAGGSRTKIRRRCRMGS